MHELIYLYIQCDNAILGEQMVDGLSQGIFRDLQSERLSLTFIKILMAQAMPTAPTPTTVILFWGTCSSLRRFWISWSLRVAILDLEPKGTGSDRRAGGCRRRAAWDPDLAAVAPVLPPAHLKSFVCDGTWLAGSWFPNQGLTLKLVIFMSYMCFYAFTTCICIFIVQFNILKTFSFKTVSSF